MDTLTRLEQAVLTSIFSETPDLASALELQKAAATVTNRRNSEAGFFTTMAVPTTAVKVISSGVLGHETQARVQGLEYGMGFVLFVRDGRLATLEGYTFESTDTHLLDLSNLNFEVFRKPITRAG